MDLVPSARAAEGEEHDRLWAMFREFEPNFDGYVKRRPAGTTVVVLEPRSEDVSSGAR